MNNKQKKLLIPIVLSLSLIITLLLVIGSIIPMAQDVISKNDEYKKAVQNKDQMEKEKKKMEEEAQTAEMRLKTIKPIYTSELDASNENLGIFGGMFDEIVSDVKRSGLMMRSIEYNLKPESDAVYRDFGDTYNVCELRLYVVGTYMQLQQFLINMNNSFPFLIHISKMDVGAFKANTDYILADLSLTLYSKKTAHDRRE